MSEGVAWFGAVIAGVTAGLIPFFVARSRQNMALAWGSLVGCIILGILGGALLAAPACIVLTTVALMKPAENERTPLEYWPIAIPAGLLILLTALGFVALSQVIRDNLLVYGSAWIVPDGIHAPIRQNVVVLERTHNKPLASEFVTFVLNDARTIIERYGYGVEGGIGAD